MQPYKILVAEDEAPFRRQVGQMLTQHGFEVISVEDGYQALDFAVHAKPDLMLLDVHMPAGDGFSVHDRVQLHPELATRPVIYMTHDPTQEIEAVAAEHGAFKLLHKPFEMSTLLETINAALVGRTADAA